ncbi:uncharacterized protein Z519_00716 [Cladophialophora bantiana CBS 173.52]|uniref:Tafazzin n=1 Tax=Cladophialophora bantiana (strain ATCC 10958 / CBS 173.52 / CDC B-1940 / NIH 8579) TaxID=1442370 RepID=A0A0D2I032_CLAB1|nr:uncharacterized protein Z519_00716 [Cladophialophora bantiana CBS 173.52]KIW99053.1 hypothetical protein Z519_00716 [Cladophialophora bantiana CBS 173.52]
MPKKHQKRVLFIKPQSSSPPTLSLSKSQTSRPQNGATERTVNDLIRESRRQQLRNDTRTPPPSTNAPSIHPSLRTVLDLPIPPTPAPRYGFGSRAAVGGSGPSRLRRIPGPPPPQSWLTDSIRAPASVRSTSLAGDTDTGNGRIQVRSSNLPEGAFPSTTSLYHLVLKKMACNWEWHAENDLDYFECLPTSLKETLLSYIAVYGEEITTNPLRVLFLHETDSEERADVRRLDLSNALGAWTTFKQLERDLLVKNTGPVSVEAMMDTQVATSDTTPDSWDADAAGNAVTGTPAGGSLPKPIHNFKNLRHLSLALSPSNAKAASWSSLLSLATELSTLTSLSLAYWPQPTFTPNAASTRAVVKIPGSRSVVYGGSDMYTSFDNNWREAAGILRTLSRSLYCLKWLDLTGCGDWFAALEWSPSPATTTGSLYSPFYTTRTMQPFSHHREKIGPEWNSGWRGLEKLVLEVGWRPVRPSAIGHGSPAQDDDVEAERRLYRYKKEREHFDQIRSTAESVARYLRTVRKEAGGKWIDVQLSEDMATYLARDKGLLEE